MNLLRRTTFLFLLVMLALKVNAQRLTELPTFQLLKTDSTYVVTTNANRNGKLMIIYFGADCTHCKLYTKELLKHMDVLSKVTILMVTWSNLQSIKNFYNEFELFKYPNFIVTTEGYTYNLYRFLQVKTTPHTTIYYKNKLIKTFDKSPIIDSLLFALKE